MDTVGPKMSHHLTKVTVVGETAVKYVILLLAGLVFLSALAVPEQASGQPPIDFELDEEIAKYMSAEEIENLTTQINNYIVEHSEKIRDVLEYLESPGHYFHKMRLQRLAEAEKSPTGQSILKRDPDHYKRLREKWEREIKKAEERFKKGIMPKRVIRKNINLGYYDDHHLSDEYVLSWIIVMGRGKSPRLSFRYERDIEYQLLEKWEKSPDGQETLKEYPDYFKMERKRIYEKWRQGSMLSTLEVFEKRRRKDKKDDSSFLPFFYAVLQAKGFCPAAREKGKEKWTIFGSRFFSSIGCWYPTKEAWRYLDKIFTEHPLTEDAQGFLFMLVGDPEAAVAHKELVLEWYIQLKKARKDGWVSPSLLDRVNELLPPERKFPRVPKKKEQREEQKEEQEQEREQEQEAVGNYLWLVVVLCLVVGLIVLLLLKRKSVEKT